MGNQHSSSSSRQDKCIISSSSSNNTPSLQLTVGHHHGACITSSQILSPNATSTPKKCQQQSECITEEQNYITNNWKVLPNINNYNQNNHRNKIKHTSCSNNKEEEHIIGGFDNNKNKMKKGIITTIPTIITPHDGAKAIFTAGNNIIHTGQNINSGVQKFSKCLVQYTRGEGSGSNMISKEIFQKYVIPKSQIACDYLWDYFKEYSDAETINEEMFLRLADKIYAQITDKEQIHFYVKVFGKGNEFVQRDVFNDFLQSAYQLSSIKGNPALYSTNNIEDDYQSGIEWMESVTKSCFHIKGEMSVFFLSNWILNNMPRVLIEMHKYIINQLTTGYLQSKGDVCKRISVLTFEANPLQNKNSDAIQISQSDQLNLKETKLNNLFPGVHPVLLWLLSCSLPDNYLSSLKPKPEQGNAHTNILNSKQLLLEMINDKSETERWTMLYNSDEHGTSINRFQFHVFNYRGPTLMFITADNGYQICLGSDTEWKESCHFWGGKDSVIIQLQPEFRIVERGEKILYSNFSIRGYPFGIQGGKDARNVSVDVKPDFQLFSFKKMPCKIEKLVVYGCGTPEAKDSQKDHKKWEAKQCQKQRTININSAEWNDNPDKYLLELAGNYKSYGNN